MVNKEQGQQPYSNELLTAQKRLLQLRETARQARIDAGLPVDRCKTGAGPEGVSVLSGAGVSQSLEIDRLQNLPDHLGWGSLSPDRKKIIAKGSPSRSHLPTSLDSNAISLIDQLSLSDISDLEPSREASFEPLMQVSPSTGIEQEPILGLSTQTALAEAPDDSDLGGIDINQLEDDRVKIFGHTLDGIHRSKKDGVGRVWLLLRYMDQEKGEGRVAIRDVRYKLTDPDGSLKCLSKKRLQQLVRAGEGVFWHKSKNGRYLHYHSEARVAAALGLSTIQGLALVVPVEDLLKPIRHIRALFHEAFHSGRQEGYGNPITRQVMHARGMSDGRTQRQYESLRGMQKRSEFAIVEKYSKAAWQRAQHEDADERVGGPAFIYIDYKGILGKNPDRFKRPKGKRHWHHIYIMRQVGNAYAGGLTTAKRGRRWTSHKLRHLCHSMSQLTGSAGEEVYSVGESLQCEKYYYESVEDARRLLRKEGQKEGGGMDRPLYSPSTGVDLDWDAENRSKEALQLRSSDSFYWQESFFID